MLTQSTPETEPGKPGPGQPGSDGGELVRSAPRLVGGVLLVLAGLVWLLDTLGFVEAQWSLLLPAGVVAVGIALILTSGRQDRGGLVALGIVLLVLAVLTGDGQMPEDQEGVGPLRVAPETLVELDGEVSHGIGEVVVDLRAVPPQEFVGGETLEVSVGIGAVTVELPHDVAVEVDGSAGIGEVVLPGRRAAGLGASSAESIDGRGEPLRLEVSTGIGRAEVRVADAP